MRLAAGQCAICRALLHDRRTAGLYVSVQLVIYASDVQVTNLIYDVRVAHENASSENVGIAGGIATYLALCID